MPQCTQKIKVLSSTVIVIHLCAGKTKCNKGGQQDERTPTQVVERERERERANTLMSSTKGAAGRALTTCSHGFEKDTTTISQTMSCRNSNKSHDLINGSLCSAKYSWDIIIIIIVEMHAIANKQHQESKKARKKEFLLF